MNPLRPVRIDHAAAGGPAAAFLDRDGVVIANRPTYVRSVADVEFLPGVGPALRRLNKAGHALLLITNQAVIGKNLITLEQALEVHQYITDHLARQGVSLTASYLCPHVGPDRCGCRKPEPGMLLRATRDLSLDPARSVMIGDACSDLEAGRRAGVDTVLLLTGRGRDEVTRLSYPATVVDDLPAAVSMLLGRRGAVR
ncbi:D-glycero-alpha-D-manno-heptose-1,7-bisphosphate 7-phosphatase [Micromonospora craniellae]|uniref:D,D-heptose 1,7-bisphosphate phosphatase n=1 Tax=Micromonospora craniellae TaxID=2294034 RepID=A0A372FRZ0_9ACTN|nr:HAD-IIIA family hydrolase [Micromonospora craniellae]QOC93477.1 HAD-IIIA family hydrolase [Micromonospora craniellae]RFS43468.1 HAD-IIIA family hydrolase [Micromonospora craniellae]